jgi:hypothetical protein
MERVVRSDKGRLNNCVKIYDTGGVTATSTFTIQITHS